ncbi:MULTISPECIES: hypothetical protein [unclassified Rhizobium]|uniref:hypothetical protein n=1 Tax=unclassified Rhizobium TaxID=2613769 RepID=UPI001ADBA35F|nr:MULTISPECIES: hypothetical protein [unclassified Rhizobium]MBO9098388.1 hypothetical protein [Rhizobium sp. L58/93]MBO9184604.1 hypothetical protein [Rhizobium sp. E27B/91]QXZ84785.1 hypothetical protein J5287_04395 [Rhizobium sp. K1/93]QXZ91076.1 hypothetical protein J5280_05605 [Rhizobium sp. K15/93]QYA00289.1 hypothetical protein J5278_10865 [Rhizobium sp. B21/90]
MAILFKTALSEDKALEKVEATILDGSGRDGYLNVMTEDMERAAASERGRHTGEFRDQVDVALAEAKQTAPFWLVYRRTENDPVTANEIRNAAIRLTRGYSGTIVIALSLLGHNHDDGDLELVFICFREDFHRRNFRVRYEHKYVPD